MTVNGPDFHEVYTLFQPKILRYLARLVGAKEAEDLTQEVFIKVDAALKNFRRESQLSTWIYRIATNTAIDRMRHPAYKRESANEQLGDSISEIRTHVAGINTASPGETCSFEETLMHQDTGQCIRGVIEKLPEHYRTVVILSELEGLPNKEIAEILELSLAAVKMRLHRGREMLKKELLSHCRLYWDERNELTCDPKEPAGK